MSGADASVHACIVSMCAYLKPLTAASGGTCVEHKPLVQKQLRRRVQRDKRRSGCKRRLKGDVY